MPIVKKVLSELELAQKLFKDSAPPIVLMAKNAADLIILQQEFIDRIGKLPNCNTCSNMTCGIRPLLGSSVRYNCAFYVGIIYDNIN